MSALGEIATGTPIGTQQLCQSLQHLRSTLELLEQGLRKPLGELEPPDRMVRPFLARSLLEVGFTCLLGRLDGFRLLTVAQFQAQPSYEAGVRLQSAIQWTGDVLALERASGDLWSPNKKVADITRALLGDYHDHVTLRPALAAALDFLNSRPPEETAGPWFDELRSFSPQMFAPWMRGQLAKLYSATSKGIHHEFVVSPSVYYDDATLAEQAGDALKLLTYFAFVANFAETALFPLEPARALTCLSLLQDA